ncbi:MAG TPA: RagB/SusD family nutrient uptake outer membrane protein [Ohtaekwangia sp.]|uniref:RagB/SusD family nutrient uptake outer membrane protein n=1 Tax=Ohtaekwangia sp. TaxID=2066019 RepID=UPI002F9531A0
MKRIFKYIVFPILLIVVSACDLLTPEPVDKLTDNLVLNEPSDVPQVEIGLYSAFRTIIPATVIAGDFTADMLLHNGTFSQYRELGNKQITATNASVATLWGAIYNTIYIANFILEKLPNVPGVSTVQRNKTMGAAHFLRGYAYFTALYTFGRVPLALTTNIQTNLDIPRSSTEDILQQVIDDYTAALDELPSTPTNASYAGEFAVRAAFARLYLFLGNWVQAEQYATQVIESGKYELEKDFATIVNTDLTDESILEVSYTIADDPGTDGNIGLNNLFVGRREIIPSNQAVLALASSEAGDRFQTIKFDVSKLKGTDNGWSVAKYGTADADNNDVVVFRLAEMYLIRAEARAQQGNVSGSTSSARTDINILRTRADFEDNNNSVPLIPESVTQSQMLKLIEQERIYELAYEGHRWYDLVRTNRVTQVMEAFTTNWRDAYTLWPIPLREIQTNKALVGDQNPGY